MNTSVIEELRQIAEERGAEVIVRSSSHIQIRGKMLVNYYPFGSKRSAYVAGTKNAKKGVTPRQAVAMAFNLPPKVKAKRRKSYKDVKEKLWNHGIRTCRWCGLDLVLEAGENNSATLEHIVPLSRGGVENRNNYSLACQNCNNWRGEDMPELRMDI